MRVPYKTIHNDHRSWTEVESDSIEYCCDEIRYEIGRKVSIESDPGHDAEPFVGVKSIPRPVSDGKLIFDYCPYCGASVDIDHLGEFEQRIEEIPVNE